MRDLFQVVFELKQKEIDDALKKMDKDKRVNDVIRKRAFCKK